MLTERQETILNLLVREYIDSANPISSDLLKKRSHLGVSPATIRNELQELTELGYLIQPHTSAGRVPTEKAYKYFIEIHFSGNFSELPNFISREIEGAKQKIGKELQLAQALMKSLEEISTTLSYTRIEEKNSMLEILKIIGPSRITYNENIDVMKKLLEELENF